MVVRQARRGAAGAAQARPGGDAAQHARRAVLRAAFLPWQGLVEHRAAARALPTLWNMPAVMKPALLKISWISMSLVPSMMGVM